MNKILTFSELNELAKKIADYVTENTVIVLNGDLGTGKTTFSKIFAKQLGVKKNVKSPTFNYVSEYLEGRIPLYHFDVYRLDNPADIYDLGYEDYLESGAILLIEWGSIIKAELPEEYIELTLHHFDENSRRVELKYIGKKEKEKELLDYVDFSN